MKKFKKNWLRHLIQWGVIVALIIFLTKVFGTKSVDSEAYCPFGGLQALVSYLDTDTLACSMTATQIMMGIFLAVAIVLFSKLFCGYLCPLGWASEYLGKLRKRFKIKPIVIKGGSIADRALRTVKYLLLFWIFYMTVTTSELFCKNFDPYYAVATGFKGEITLWMSLVAILIFIVGNFFINMFWCKYLCPLGALSNIFKFTITFVVLLVVYLLLGSAGLHLSWLWLLGAAALLSWLWEIIFLESKFFPLLKLKRDTEKCNDCGLCPTRCPYGIDVDQVDAVKHVDCTLCGECITACNQDALSFGGKKWLRWAPAILAVALFFGALFYGQSVELPTLNKYWYENRDIPRDSLLQFKNIEKVKIEGLRSITCSGSSLTFKAKLMRVPGVYGVTTFVKHSYAIIHFDPSETNEDKIKEQIYVPSKFKINTPSAEVEEVKVITFYAEKMSDRLDLTYLGMKFRQSERGAAYYGLESEYGCPLIVRLYMDSNEPIDEKFIKEIVQQKELVMPVAGGGERKIKTAYDYEGMEQGSETITRLEFLRSQLSPFAVEFKKNQEEWGGKSEAVYKLIYPGLDKPIVTRNLPYLSNWLSQNEGFLSIKTLIDEQGQYCFHITYSKEVLDEEKIWEVLTQEKWKVRMRSGDINEVDAKLSFKNRGTTIEIEQ
ncbi:MAG: 4Fe-4S binding protein [Bacteroidales bacterium]